MVLVSMRNDNSLENRIALPLSLSIGGNSPILFFRLLPLDYWVYTARIPREIHELYAVMNSLPALGYIGPILVHTNTGPIIGTHSHTKNHI